MARRSVEELDAQVNTKLRIGTSAKPSYSKKKSVEELDAQVDNKIHKSNIEVLKSAETFNNFSNDVKKNIAGQGSNKNTTLYGLPEKTLALQEQVELNKELNVQPEIIRGYDYDTEKMKVDHWTGRLKKAQQLVIDIGNATSQEEKERLTLIYNNMSPDNNEDTVRAIQKVLAPSKERVDYFEKLNERETANNEYLKKLADEQQFFQNIFSIKDPNSKFYDEKFDYYVQSALDWDKNKVAGVKNGKTAKELGISEDDYLRYQNLTDEEYEAYNYFLGRYGGETAKQFINQIERSSNSLSLRAAKQMKDEIYSNDDLGLKTIGGAGVGGLERWGQHIGRAIYNTVFYMFNDPDGYYGEEYYRQDVGQLANQLSREEKGGVVKIASDVADAGGYMLPSILEAAAVTYITKGMGASEKIINLAGRATSALSMGTAVARGSFEEMRNLGYSREQAQTYALISGLSEVCLESVLGGIKIPGGAVTGTTAEGFARSLNKVIGKISIEYGDEIAHFISEIGSEALEESLQEFLSPIFKQIATGDEFESAKLEDVLYAGFLGALSASVINSSQNLVSDTVNAFNTVRTGEDIIYGKNAPDFINSLRENANLYPVDSVVGKLSRKFDEKANAYNIGKLFNAENAYLTSQNFTDIQKSLEEKGVNSSDAQTIAQTFAKVVVGEEVSDAEITAIKINKPLFETINDIILNPSSTVNQRTGTVFDLSQKFSDIKKAQKEKATNLTSKIKTAENGKILDVADNAELVSLAEEMHTLPAELTDVNTLTPIANTMGVNGGKALMSVYDGNVSTDVYSGEFLKVYNAVLKGNEIPEVSHLTPAQKQAAIFSSQNDLKAKNTVAKNEQISYNENITFEEESALLSYKSGDSYTLNGMIRELNGVEELDEYRKEMSNKLDTALEKLPVYKGRVYRNIGFDDFTNAEEQYNAFMSEIEPNTPFIDAAFMSTSTRKDGYLVEGKYVVHMEIESLNGRNLEGFGNNFESEVLFPRNSVFIVDDIVYDSDGVPTIYMEEIENAGKILDTEKSYGAVRDVQKHNSEDSNVQGVSEWDTNGNATRNVGPQGSISGGQRDFVRTQGPQQDNSSTTRQKQSGITNIHEKLKNERSQIKGETDYAKETGTESGSESQQRTRSVDSSKQSATVLGRTEKTQSRYQTAESRGKGLRDKVNSLGNEKVSTASLGISKGTSEKTLKVVPRSMYTQEMEAHFKEQFKKGVTVIYFVGELQMKDENGNIFTARGAVSAKGTRMFVRADHETLSVTQIIKHEQFHIAVMKDPSLLEKVSQNLIQKYGEEDLDELVNSYVDEYGWDSMDMSYQEIVEEILADAYAGIDVFDYLSTYEGATRYTEDVVDQVESHTIENETNRGPPEIKNTDTESDDVKFSIARTKNISWEKQIEGYYRDNNVKIRHSDTLVVSNNTPKYLQSDKIKDFPLAIPLSIISKAQKGKNEDHNISTKNIKNLKKGIEESIAVIHDVDRNTILVITNLVENGKPIVVTFDLNDIFDGDKVHKCTSIYTRTDIRKYLENLSNTEIFIKNKNKFVTLCRETDILDRLQKNNKLTNVILSQKGLHVNHENSQSDRKSSKTSREKPKANNLEEANALLKEQFDEIKSLKKDLSKAESEAKQYRAQVKLTEKVIAMREDRIKKLARRLFDNYSVEIYNLNISEVIESLENLGEYISNGDRDGTFSYTAVKDKAVDIATQLIDNARELVDDGQREIYNELRKYLRNTRLTLSEQDRADIGENWNDFRRKYFGTINLSNKGLPVDSAYMELQSMYGNSYFPEKYTHPADQLAHIAEVMDKLKPVYENPNNHDMAAAIECCANDIVYSLFNEEVQQSSKMILHEHDKYVRLREEKNSRIKELQKEGVKNTQEALEKIRKQRDEKVRSIKKEWEDKKSTFYEVQRQIELREMITRHSKELSKKLLRPTDKQHIPEDLKRPVAKLLELINLESVYTIDETGKRRKNPYGIPTKRTEAFKEIRAAYKELADDLVISPELFEGTEGGLFEKVEKLSDKPIAYMNSEELLVIWKTISAVEATITSYNQAFSLAKEKAISDIALSLKNDNKHKKIVDIIGWNKKLTNVDMLTPETFFHELGETGDMLFRGLRNAQDKYIEIFSKVEEFAKELKADSNKLEKEIHEVTLGGQTVNISTANLMELYVLYNRPHAKRHIEKGGVSFQRAKGLKKKNYSSQVYTGITVYELEAAFAKIGAENIKKAEEIQEFLSTVMADYGNEASMQVFNYKKYLEQHYWPIRVSGEEIPTSLESVTAIKSIANKSHAKQTVENAKASIEVGSIFDTFISHCVDMSSYAAYLAPMQDMTRIINSKFYTELGESAGTVKEVIKNVYGTHGNKNIGLDYIQNLIADISSPGKVDKEYTSGLFANFKAVAVGLNLRVVAQQPTAILRAFDMINPKYFVNLKNSISGWNKAKRYAPIAQWKDWGYFDINTGLSAKEIAFGNDNALSFVREKSMALAGLADSVSWGMLWNTCEAEIKDTHKELKVGSEEFYKTVAQRFTEIIDHTQVVDGVLQRSQIMRKKDSLTKMSTAFMGEPTKIYNMLRSAWYDVKNAKDNALRKKARVKLARSVVFLCISNFINAVVQSLVDAFRDDDRDETYWQKFLQAFFGFEGDEKKTLSYIQSFISGNVESAFIPFNYFPYAKDLISLFQGYDVSRTDMQGMSDLVNASITLVNALTSEEGDKYNTVGLFANFFAKAANVLGIPVANLKRDIESIVNTVSLLSENYLFQYYSKKLTLNVNHIGNAALFKDILWDAYQNDPVAYEKIYSDLEKEGFKMESIKNYFEDRMKEAQNVKSVDDLKERYLSPTQERKYDSSLSKVKKSNVWKSASSKDKKEIEKDIYNLTVQNSAGEKFQEKIDEAKRYGINETEYLLYCLALDCANKDGNDNYNQDETEVALEMLSGLSPEEKSYLWKNTNKSWKYNPYD